MGMKAKAQMPPPIDTSVTDRTAEKEAALKKEEERMRKAGQAGRGYTIATSGLGDESEVKTGKTLLTTGM